MKSKNIQIQTKNNHNLITIRACDQGIKAVKVCLQNHNYILIHQSQNMCDHY